jgi:aminoglycoside phosphotransferase
MKVGRRDDPPLAGAPSDGDFDVPAGVLRLAAGAPIRAVWRNQAGGLTFAIGDRAFVKWGPGAELRAEAERLRWAGAYVPVPRVLGSGADAEGAWLVTEAIPGENAVSERWAAEPERAVRAIGRGLRRLHDRLPVEECPFSWSTQDRTARAAERAIDRAEWHVEHRGFTVEEMLERAARPPEIDRLVVCHGDACAPNTIIAEDGEPSGHVDLGTLGVADRWADLAVATWSADWNYGPGWQEALLEAYGVEPDPVRTGYYRLLWDLE